MYKKLFYNRNTYIHWCVYIETKLQKVYKEQVRERKDGRAVGRQRVHLFSWMHQKYTFRCRFAQHHLRTGRSPWPPERNIQIHANLSNMKEGREKEEWTNWTCTQGVGELKAGARSPLWGSRLEPRGRLLENRGADLRQSEWSENHIDDLCAALRTLVKATSPLEQAAVGCWNTGTGEQSQREGCCWQWGDGLREWEGDSGREYLWGKAGQPMGESATAES